MNTLYSLFKITRPLNVFLACSSVFIAIFHYIGITNLHIHSSSGTILIYTLPFWIFTVCFYTAAANSINDIFDILSDKINHPERPLASETLNKNNVIIFSIILLLLGFLASLNIHRNAFYFVNLIIVPLIFIYTPLLKKVPILGNIIIGFIVGSVFLFIQLCLFGKIVELILFSLAFSFTLIRELAKDMSDIMGDEQFNTNTFPVIYGLKKSLVLMYILLAFMVIISLSPLFFYSNNFLYLFTLIIIVYAPLIIGIFSLQKNLTISSAKEFSNTTKLITITGMITTLLLDINIS